MPVNMINLFAPKQSTSKGPLPYDQQMLEAKRQQALAEMLLKQAAEDIPIQSYKGIQAPIPWTAVLGKALQGGMASSAQGEATRLEQEAGLQDQADAEQRIALLTRGRKGMPTQAMTVDGTTPQLPGEPAPAQGPQAEIAATDGYTKLTPEEIMAEVLRGGGPKAREAMEIAGPRLFAQQDRAEARALDVKDKTRRYLTPQEVAAKGYRPGSVISVDAFNNADVEQAPDTLSPEAVRQRIQIAQASHQPREGSWGQPIMETDPVTNKPIQVRYNSTGARMVVPGALPKDAGRAPPVRVQDTALKTGAALMQQDSLLANYRDEFSGHFILGDASNTIKSHMPGGDPTGQSDWWANYAKYVNAVRNDQFGASLTPGEKAEFEKTVATPGMSPEETRKRLAEGQAITLSAAARQTRLYRASGYNQEALEGAYGFDLDEIDQRDKAVQAARAARQKPAANAGGAGKPPQGITQAEWNAMSPEGRKLWQ